MKILLTSLFFFFLIVTFALFVSKVEGKPCVKVTGTVVSSYIIQPTFQRRWFATTGKAVLTNGQEVNYYSRPDNLYEVGDDITSYINCGRLNQELLRKHP